MAEGMRYVTPKSVQRVLDDLLTAEQAAEFIDLPGGGRALHSYVRHFSDFPPPVNVNDSGRCPLWLRSHLTQWRKVHPRRGGSGDEG